MNSSVAFRMGEPPTRLAGSTKVPLTPAEVAPAYCSRRMVTPSAASNCTCTGMLAAMGVLVESHTFTIQLNGWPQVTEVFGPVSCTWSMALGRMA